VPTVSIIIPCYNEQTTIRLLLKALYQQSFPRREMEIIVVDGLSTDKTRDQIVAFTQENPELPVKVIDNPRRNIPTALNLGIANASGEILIRMDAHALPYSDYIDHCVEALEQGHGDNVGGVWEIHPGGETWMARAIAYAAAHPLGVGDAHYRHTNQAQAADTVPFFAFRRSLVERIGVYDETLLTNEDYEFNVRIRQAGGKVWLDPSIRSIYYARPTLAKLAQQYWRYGYWKGRMLMRYPHTLRWRQALPPLFVASLIGLCLLAIFFPRLCWLLAIEIAAYTLTLFVAGFQAFRKKRQATLLAGVPLAIGVMHITWGSALLWSLLQSMTGALTGKIRKVK
jgi:succinoglycan biosynthesis protein ExoA